MFDPFTVYCIRNHSMYLFLIQVFKIVVSIILQNFHCKSCSKSIQKKHAQFYNHALIQEHILTAMWCQRTPPEALLEVAHTAVTTTTK